MRPSIAIVLAIFYAFTHGSVSVNGYVLTGSSAANHLSFALEEVECDERGKPYLT